MNQFLVPAEPPARPSRDWFGVSGLVVIQRASRSPSLSPSLPLVSRSSPSGSLPPCSVSSPPFAPPNAVNPKPTASLSLHLRSKSIGRVLRSPVDTNSSQSTSSPSLTTFCFMYLILSR